METKTEKHVKTYVAVFLKQFREGVPIETKTMNLRAHTKQLAGKSARAIERKYGYRFLHFM